MTNFQPRRGIRESDKKIIAAIDATLDAELLDASLAEMDEMDNTPFPMTFGVA